MSIPGSSSPLFFQTAAAAADPFEGPARSARFDADNYNFLYRTPSSAGNRRKWTWAGWIKRSRLGSEDGVFSSYGDAHPNTAFVFNQDNTFQFHDFANSSFNFKLVSNRVLRDVNSWYHIIVAVDTTQSIAAYRIRIYINGTLLSSSDYSTAQWPSENFETDLNSATRTDIGYHAGTYFSGYMADIHFIDGQQVDHTEFGGFDDNGVWQAKDYTGTYGSNGYRINFSNVSSAVSFGEDSSGNDNDHGVQGFRYVAGPFASYTPYLTASSGGFNSSHPAHLAFNGDQGTHAKAASAGASLTFQPSSSISYSSSVQTRTPTADSNVSINGGSASFAEGGNTWTTIATGSGTISSIVFNTTGGSDIMSLAGIKIDGEYLYDHTAGARTDVYRDSPVNGTQTDAGAGGELTSNYSTMNPLAKNSNTTVSSGNLEVSSTAVYTTLSTIGFPSSGKFYAEFIINGTASGYPFVGIGAYNDTAIYSNANPNTGAFYAQGGYVTGSVSVSSLTALSAGDIVGVAYDASNGKVWFSINGTYVSSGNPGSGSNATCTLSANDSGYCWATSTYQAGEVILNAGQRAFAFDAPTDFKCLCAANLPTPAVADGKDGFETKLWTGNGSSRTISGFSMRPDIVWMKNRGFATDHEIYDRIRGVENVLKPNLEDAEATESNGLLAFGSTSFNIGNHNPINRNNDGIVAWVWNAGSGIYAQSNSNGSVTSSVRANQTTGCSIVTWTSSNETNHTWGHGLGAAPQMVWLKRRGAGTPWLVGHDGMGWTKKMNLNNTSAAATNSAYWQDTAPTSTVVYSGTSSRIGGNNVAYCFTPIEGFSSFNSYVGNGSSDGTFVYTGFRPSWILLKNSSNAYHWYIYDTARVEENAVDVVLLASAANADSTSTNYTIDILSNGFKARTSNARVNASGDTYIYAAFAENPFQANGGLAR